MLPWSIQGISHYPWYTLPDLSGNLVAVIFVTASSTLFNTAGIEVATHRARRGALQGGGTGQGGLDAAHDDITVSRSGDAPERRRIVRPTRAGPREQGACWPRRAPLWHSPCRARHGGAACLAAPAEHHLLPTGFPRPGGGDGSLRRQRTSGAGDGQRRAPRAGRSAVLEGAAG